MPNEKPILFKPEMVRAILDGKKTQTRRVVKNINPTFLESKPTGEQIHNAMRCPYGEVGDRLWVREPFDAINGDSEEQVKAKIHAAQNIKSVDQLMKWCELPSGGGPKLVLYKADYGEWANDVDSDLGPWKPSIHMPRLACRLVLEITDVRVERLQDITEADAMAEGVTIHLDAVMAGAVAQDTPARMEFWSLWNSIHNKDGYDWDKSPWVWVRTFKRT